jgi:hypothetical protein
MKTLALILILLVFALTAKANNQIELTNNELTVIIEWHEQLESTQIYFDEAYEQPAKVKFKRGKAILFTVFTGLFGGHRIYFGTHHRTPIIYSITLGGLGILPLVDLINIIFTKDINKFDNKTQIIMWGD